MDELYLETYFPFLEELKKEQEAREEDVWELQSNFSDMIWKIIYLDNQPWNDTLS